MYTTIWYFLYDFFYMINGIDADHDALNWFQDSWMGFNPQNKRILLSVTKRFSWGELQKKYQDLYLVPRMPECTQATYWIFSQNFQWPYSNQIEQAIIDKLRLCTAGTFVS